MLFRSHLAAALLCAGGTERPPRGERLTRLVERIPAGEVFTATLAGARVEAAETVLICRDAGEIARGGLARLDLAPRETGVWDGRWEITAGDVPVTVTPLTAKLFGLATVMVPVTCQTLSVPASCVTSTV